MSIVIPGQQSLNMEDIQRQEVMRRALIERTVLDTGSRVFANLVAGYVLNMPVGAKLDIQHVRKLAAQSKDLSMFYAEAHGMVTLQVQQDEPTTEVEG